MYSYFRSSLQCVAARKRLFTINKIYLLNITSATKKQCCTRKKRFIYLREFDWTFNRWNCLTLHVVEMIYRCSRTWWFVFQEVIYLRWTPDIISSPTEWSKSVELKCCWSRHMPRSIVKDSWRYWIDIKISFLSKDICIQGRTRKNAHRGKTANCDFCSRTFF